MGIFQSRILKLLFNFTKKQVQLLGRSIGWL